MSALDGEGGAVEDQFVLAAELVGVEHRQAALDHLPDHHLLAHVDLAAVVGRAVRHEQDLRAAFGQRLADAEIAPDVLADRDAEPHAAEIDRPRHVRAGLEHALLVELAIVRQVDLEALGDDLAAVGDDDGVVRPLLRFSGVPMMTPGPPSAVSLAKSLTALSQAARKAGFSTRSSGG